MGRHRHNRLLCRPLRRLAWLVCRPTAHAATTYLMDQAQGYALESSSNSSATAMWYDSSSHSTRHGTRDRKIGCGKWQAINGYRATAECIRSKYLYDS